MMRFAALLKSVLNFWKIDLQKGIIIMKKNLLTASAVIAAAAMAVAAPQPPKPQAEPQPVKTPIVKPQPVKTQPVKTPVVIIPQDRPIEYHPVRNTYTIQINANNTIIFEQRIVGMQELRDKIRMVKHDRPRPLIQIKVEDHVDTARLNYALDELKMAGFDDVKIIRIQSRQKFVPRHRIPDKRIRR